MKRSVLFMALLSLVVQASAVPVTVEQAKSAASAWTARGGTLGARLGASVERASTLSLESGDRVYAVKMRGGGSVFVAADDDLGPVVAFTAATNDFSTIDVRSPLWALLSRDAEVRAFARTNAAAKASASAKAAGGEKASRTATPIAFTPDDLRVAPLVQSKWDQETADGKLCYNRFTPILKTGKPATCGCVATAMAQIMRYHEFPTAAVAPVTRTCYVNMYAATKANDPDCVTNLTTQAGVYDWASMTLVPKDGVTDAQCDAIGRLTSDAGIAVYMSYGRDTYGSSGAFVANVAKALTDVFSYADADYYSSSEVSSSPTAMRQGLFANLDAGLPVLLGITSSQGGGHAIVGDGYGYESGLPYVHLNMGWAGQDDYWYNLPDIGTFAKFDIFDDMVLNIIPEDADGALLAGHVTDAAGAGLADVAVSVCAAGATTSVTSGVTSATGVYAFRVPAGTYDLTFEKAGLPAETLTSVRVAKTQTRSKSFPGTLRNDTNVTWSVSYSGVPDVSSFGNSWGNDVTLTAPRARIVVGAVTNVYATLDKALAAAKAIVSAGAPLAKVEILDEIPLAATATVDFPCALTAAGTDPAATPVVRSGNAALAVAAGGALALSNVAFKANASTAVTVEAGGTLALASDVDFGVPSSVAAVRTADAAGLVLLGALTDGFGIDCAAAPDVGGVFGRATCDVLTASNSAAMVSNVRDGRGETRGIAVEDGGAVLLKWSEVPVPMSESAGYFVDAAGATNTAARLDRLLEKYANLQATGAVGETGEIVVRDLEGLELATRFAVAGDLTLRGETAGVTVGAFGGAAGFDVGAGAKLTVRDLAFDGYVGDSLFRIDGGELAVGGVTSFTDVEGTNVYSGAIAVMSGKATVGSAGGSVVFDGCVNGTANSKGGAIYLKGAGCELVLQDRVTVTNGLVRSAGGGVYVGKNAAARLSGYLTIQGNEVASSASKSSASDISYYRASKTAAHTLVLAGPLETGSAVGVRGDGSYASSVTTAGGTFLAVDAAFTDHAQILQSCERLFCDTDETLAATPAADYATLLWEADDGSVKPVDPSAAVASVTDADGAVAYYGSLADAFGVVTGAATVTLLADADLSDDILVTNAVTLTSGEGGPFTVSRAADCLFAVQTAAGALTLTDVTVAGALDGSRYGTGPLFDVQYGELTLGDGATVRDVASGAERAGGAIKVYRGRLTMLDGSAIRACANRVAGNNRGGAVTADTLSLVRLLGGTVTDCASDCGGGVYVGNESTVEVGGGFVATANAATDGSANNLYVAAKSALLLASPFTGGVGYVPGVTASSVVFGRVASAFSGTSAELADSAHNFTHDLTGDVGIAVKPASGAGETLLVWSDALDADGTVAVDGTNYVTVAGGATLTAEVTAAETGLVYSGEAQAPTFKGHGFTVAVAAQTAAGDYTATLTPKAGFAWDDGTTAARTVSWTIAKAAYDMSGVTFEDRTFTYDGEPHSLAISGTLPDGVTVAYSGNGQTEVGEYVVTATFTGADAANYEAIPVQTATLTIVEATPDPGPEPDPPTPAVETNSPTPIAFESITRLSETSWRLVVTNRVPWCWYRLLSTDDLTAGFVTTNEWEQAPADATPAWTNDVETTGAALFWKAEGKEGEVGEEK